VDDFDVVDLGLVPDTGAVADVVLDTEDDDDVPVVDDPSDDTDEVELAREVLDDVDLVCDRDVVGLKIDNEDDVDAVKLRRDCEDVIDCGDVVETTVNDGDDVPDVGEVVDVVELMVDIWDDDDVNLELVADELPTQDTATSSWCSQS